MVIWTTPARGDLKHIHDFIAEDSTYYAKKVTQDIREKTDILNTVINIGKTVPEIGKPEIKELHIYSYRVIYEIRNEAAHILTVIHQRKNFSTEDLP